MPVLLHLHQIPPFLKIPYPSGTIENLHPPPPGMGKKPADVSTPYLHVPLHTHRCAAQFWNLQTVHLEGFQPAIYSCVMNGVLDNLTPAFEKLAKSPMRFLIVHVRLSHFTGAGSRSSSSDRATRTLLSR